MTYVKRDDDIPVVTGEEYATLSRQESAPPIAKPFTADDYWRFLTEAVEARLNRWRSGILLFPPARQGHREGVQRCIDELETVWKVHGWKPK